MADQTPSEGTIRKLPPDEKGGVIIRKVPTDERMGGGLASGFLNIPRQFLAGVGDVTGLLARVPELAFGTIEFTAEGPQFLTPAETTERLQQGRAGIPGQATTEPAGLFGRAGRFAGQTAAVGPVLGRAAGLVSAPETATLGLTKLGLPEGQVAKVVARVGETFARKPLAATGGEAALGAVAGAGGFIAEQLVPDSDAAVLVGELLAPTLLSLTPTALALKAIGGIGNLWNLIRHPFTAPGAQIRGAKRARRSATPDQREKAVVELDKPTTIDPETGQAVLSPAQRAGVPGLLSLEKAVVESSEELLRAGDEQIARANKVIQESLQDLGGAPAITATLPIGAAQREMSNLLDTNFRIAAQRADERIGQLGPKVTPEQANRIAREELDRALTAARNQREELFLAIPENTATPFAAVEARYNAFLKELGRPARGDIPEEATRWLNKKSKDYFGKNLPPGFQKGETRIKDLRALSSKLRETARNARAGDKKNLNQARIADELADTILDDLDNVAAGPEVTEALSIAVSFSRDMSERFSQGTVGKLLGRRVAGDPVVPAGLTLEQSIGMAGARAREGVDDLVKAFDSPEAPGASAIIAAAEDFTRSRFLKAAVVRGEFNAHAADRFVRNNEELLNRMMGLRRQINEAIESGEKLAVAGRQRARVDLGNPRVSKATMLIQKGPAEAFREISRLRPADAATETQQLINRVIDDTTGEALSGLKSGYIDFLLASARQKTRDVGGKTFVSGFALRDALEVPGARAAANRLFSKEELTRIGIVTRDLIRIENRLAVKLPKEGVIGDKPSKVVETIAGITGAAVGRTQAAKIGIGGTVQIPGIVADRFRALTAAGVADPARRLIQDAIQDETLFRDLLQSGVDAETKRISRLAEKRLNAWVVTVLAEYGGAFEEENVPGALF